MNKNDVNIESLEIKLLKTSEINDGDTIIVKIDDNYKKSLDKDKIYSIYSQIKDIVKKDISIYFFPKSLSLSLIKEHIKNTGEAKNELIENKKNENN
jgi:hypothetical protein